MLFALALSFLLPSMYTDTSILFNSPQSIFNLVAQQQKNASSFNLTALASDYHSDYQGGQTCSSNTLED